MPEQADLHLLETPPQKPGTPAPAFQQKLGLFDATMLVAGTMIGSGIFIVAATMALEVGATGWLLALWILTGVMTLAGALSYAELAAMMPNAGGQYVFLREAYSPLWGFLYGWTCFLVIQTGSIAAVGVAFAKYLGVLVPQLGTDQIVYRARLGIKVPLQMPWMSEKIVFFERDEYTISAGQLVGVAVVVLLTLLNCRGIREGKWVQNIFTLAKIAGLIMLIVLGLTVAANSSAIAANLNNLWDGMWKQDQATEQFAAVHKILPVALLAALMVCGGTMVYPLFAADAWNNVTFTAGETRNPKRNLPLSLALGTGMVITLYLLANLAYLAALPLQGDKVLAAELKAEMQAGTAAANAIKARADVLKADATNMEADVAKLQAALLRLQKEGKTEEAIFAEAHALYLLAHAEFLKDEATAVAGEAQRQGDASKAAVEKKYRESSHALGISHARDDRVGTAALQQISPDLAVPLMAVAIMISTFGCVNGLILMGGRLYYAMAQDRLFFRSVGELNPRGVPAAGLILQGIWSVLLIFSGTYGELLDYVIFASLLFYVLTVTGLFVLRRTRPNLERPYKAFGYPIVPLVYVILCAVIMVDLLIVKPVYSWPSFLIILSGIPVYFLWRMRARRAAA